MVPALRKPDAAFEVVVVGVTPANPAERETELLRMHPRRRTFSLIFSRFLNHAAQTAQQGAHLCAMQTAGGSEVCLCNH